MRYYEFQVVYDSDGKVIFCQCTGNEDETNTRPLSVWLGNCAGKNVVSKNTKVRKSIDPSLHNVLLAMNYILHVH